MAEYENTQYTDEMEFEVPKKSRETVKRLWKSMGRQRIRLMIVAVSVVFYTVLSVAAPVYSAKIVRRLRRPLRQERFSGYPGSMWDGKS